MTYDSMVKIKITENLQAGKNLKNQLATKVTKLST